MSKDYYSIDDDSQIKPISKDDTDRMNETIYIIVFVVGFIGLLFLLLVVIPTLLGS